MKRTLFLIITLFAIGTISAQNSVWNRISASEVTAEKLDRDSHPTTFAVYKLNLEVLKSKLRTAPSRNSGVESNVVVAFPNPQGELRNYRIYEASVMHPDLASRYTDIQSYVGQGVDDKSAVIRFSTTIFGLHTMTLSGIDGTTFIDPYTKDLKTYMVFNKSDLTTTKTFRCDVVDTNNLAEDLDEDILLHRANNSLFKTYRLALACTIEYAAFHVAAAGLGSGTLAQKKAAVLAAMAVTMTRVNGVFENDMSLTMVLIPNNDAIINITSDNYDNLNTDGILLDQNQTQIDLIIGTNNYDIGHVASTGGGGVASPQGPCNASIKARGVTGLPSPVGDEYDIDFVAHEMGHQFGCSHTFNGDTGNCGDGNRVTSSAYEPGSGTTVMGYAGICAPLDVQPHSDAYFHTRSIIQMTAFVNGDGNACPVVVPNGNTPPTITALPTYNIPVGTPFALTAEATDVENNAGLTYCWEQYNFQISTQPPVATSTVGPNFRSYNPTTSPTRYFPKMSDILANNLAPTWEVIPTVARAMAFSLIVRDNQSPNGGQTQRATTTVNFINAGPLKVTSQSVLEAWSHNSLQNVTWDVNGTNANGINATTVNIRMSVDGGLTFPYLLAENTPNDGIEQVTAPASGISTTCRIKVEAANNIFFAVNAINFALGSTLVNTCNSYTINTPFALPDGVNSYTTRQINVPTAGVVSDVNINIKATHPNLQNLLIAVQRPGGTLGTLFNQQCAGSANMDITFDAQGTALTCGSPTAGSYVPPTPLNMNSYNGVNPQGNWTFGFKDLVAGNSGTINSITLTICTSILADADFEFENFALYPNPNNGSFTVQFDSKSGNKIDIDVHDMRGRRIFNKQYNNNGLFSENLQLENAEAGVYLVSISDGNKQTTKRIVIQ